MKMSWSAQLRAYGVAALLVIGSFGCDSRGSVRAGGEIDQNPAVESRERLRIGKLIKKRQIAPVTSLAQADWLQRPEREAEEQPDRVVAELNIRPGSTVVDLGAGVGYFTWRLAKQVGPQGRVIAVDVQQGMLDLLRDNLRERNITNAEIVLGRPDDPQLPVGGVDLALLVDVYHELQQPEKIMEHVRRSLKPDGRVVIISYRKDDPSIPISPLSRLSVQEMRSELEPMGFRFIEQRDFLPTQHIVIFKDARG